MPFPLARRRFGGALALVWALLCTTVTAAASDSNLNQVLEGFDRPAVPSPAQPSLAPRPVQESDWKISGSLQAVSVVSLESHRPPSSDLNYKGLTNLQERLNLIFEGRLKQDWRLKLSGHSMYDLAYAIRGRDKFTSQILKEQEQETEIDEAYLQGPLGPELALKMGRQVLRWGSSDLFRSMDLFNPQDQRFPGLLESEDLFLPTFMTRLDYLKGQWRITGFAQHELRLDKLPAHGSDFFPFNFPLPPEMDTGFDPAHTGLGLRAMRSLVGLDLAVNLAWFSKEQELVGITPQTPERRINRLLEAGFSGELARDAFTYKIDAAVIHGLEYYQLSGETKTRFDLTIGADYLGFRQALITFEIAYRHLFAMDPDMGKRIDMPRADTLAFGLHFSRSFLRERLKAELTAYIIGIDGRQGGMQKLSLRYSLADGVNLSAGLLFFQKGDNYIFQYLGDNDRAFLQLKYDF